MAILKKLLLILVIISISSCEDSRYIRVRYLSNNTISNVNILNYTIRQGDTILVKIENYNEGYISYKHFFNKDKDTIEQNEFIQYRKAIVIK